VKFAGITPQVELHQRLLIDAGARLVDADDLRQCQDTALLKGLCFRRRLCAEVRQRQRDQHVRGSYEKADPEHPLQQAALPRSEVDGQKDGTDETAADQHHDLRLDVTP
jgi:hypothetical protein